MAKTSIQIELKAEVGDSVWVLNYRRRPAQWESGSVRNVNAGFRNQKARVSYEVVLDRKTKPDRWGFESLLLVTVGDDGIEFISSPDQTPA